MVSNITINKDNIDQFKEQLAIQLRFALYEIGLIAQGYAQDYETAVDTGRLRGSITYRVMDDENAVYIGTNVPYAPYIELGHHNYPGVNGGKGFLRPAATEHADEYRSIVNDKLKG